MAVGLAALSGALAVGNDAQAQIVNVPVNPGNGIGITPGGTTFNNYPNYAFGPGNAAQISFSIFKTGSTVKSYLRNAGTHVFQLAVSTTSQKPENYQVGSYVSGNLSAGSTWKSLPALLSSFKFPVSVSATKSFDLAFRFSTTPGNFDYGWIGIQSVNADGGGYAHITQIQYDASGNPIEIPEPASASLLAMGAMAMGARGVRRMKQARAAKKAA